MRERRREREERIGRGLRLGLEEHREEKKVKEEWVRERVESESFGGLLGSMSVLQPSVFSQLGILILGGFYFVIIKLEIEGFRLYNAAWGPLLGLDNGESL